MKPLHCAEVTARAKPSAGVNHSSAGCSTPRQFTSPEDLARIHTNPFPKAQYFTVLKTSTSAPQLHG